MFPLMGGCREFWRPHGQRIDSICPICRQYDSHVKWICNAKVTKVEAGKMFVTEMNEGGTEKKQHELPFKYSMMLPAFNGVEAVFGIEGLTNPRTGDFQTQGIGAARSRKKVPPKRGAFCCPA